MPRSRYRFGADKYPYFMTNTVVAWLPVFCQPDFAKVILDSWQFLQREREIDILSFVIMENPDTTGFYVQLRKPRSQSEFRPNGPAL